MKNYTKNLTWAVVSMLDRSTQDDNKSKVQIAGLVRLIYFNILSMLSIHSISHISC